MCASSAADVHRRWLDEVASLTASHTTLSASAARFAASFELPWKRGDVIESRAIATSKIARRDYFGLTTIADICFDVRFPPLCFVAANITLGEWKLCRRCTVCRFDKSSPYSDLQFSATTETGINQLYLKNWHFQAACVHHYFYPGADWLFKQSWLIRKTGPMSIGVTENRGTLQTIFQVEPLSPFFLAKGPWARRQFHSLLQHLTWWPTWLADQAVNLVSARLLLMHTYAPHY